MNKTIKELAGATNIALEVINTTVKETFNEIGWKEIHAHTFPNKNIVLVNVQPSGKNFYINYFDDTVEAVLAVVVPPDFLLKQIEPTGPIAALIEKFDKQNLKNLHNSCYFMGKIGSDPEIFCEEAKGKIIPAFKFLPAKEKSLVVEGYGENYNLGVPDTGGEYGNNIYWDGFQAEFTTRPSTCMGWHGDSLQSGLRGLYQALKQHDKKAKLSIKTVADISDKALREAPPECVTFGCNASLNVYGMKGLEMPGTAINYRSAGGHVHLGFNDKPTTEQMHLMVKSLDAILGVAGVSMCAKYDDPRRRIMYGLAGEYRLPPHGLEYRVLSNAWLFHPVIANIVFDLARSAAMFGKSRLLKHWKATEQETIQCINTCDVTLARRILKDNEKLFKLILKVKLYDDDCVDYSHKAITEGLESIIADPADIVGNWGLNKKWNGHCDGPDKNVHYTIGKGGSGGKKKI